MKKKQKGLIALIISLFLSIIIIIIYFQVKALGSIYYLPAFFSSEPSEVCKYKSIIWGKKLYEVFVTDGMAPFSITLDEKHESYWIYMFQSIPGSQIKPGRKPHNKQYVFCNASIQSSRKDSSSNFKKDSPGVIISLRDSIHRKLLTFTLSVGMDAFRYTNEDYDFDAVMQDFAKNIHITKPHDGSLILRLQASDGGDKPFHYEVTQINDMFIEQYNIQLISIDQGKTWNMK